MPIYRETKGLKSLVIRKALKAASEWFIKLPETLPSWIVQDYKLMSRAEAVQAMHFPTSDKELEEAKHRLGFDEVFGLTLAALLNKNELLKARSVSIPFERDLAVDFVGSLPFKLTDEQRAVVWQIYKDIEKTSPMNRLVEGDVGTGKTVVATMAAVMAMKQGFQVAFMAPTELLARQHAETIHRTP